MPFPFFTELYNSNLNKSYNVTENINIPNTIEGGSLTPENSSNSGQKQVEDLFGKAKVLLELGRREYKLGRDEQARAAYTEARIFLMPDCLSPSINSTASRIVLPECGRKIASPLSLSIPDHTTRDLGQARGASPAWARSHS